MRAAAAVAALLVLTACAGSGSEQLDAPRDQQAERGQPTPSTTAVPVATAPATTAPSPPAFDGEVFAPDAVASRVVRSWRPGCPVGPSELRIVAVDHWGYDGLEHRGELVVHRDHAEAMLSAFRALFDARFPIERMEPVDTYGADDHLSTRANNTAAFNCRWVVGQPGNWSNHAFGFAIDVNPLVNPYVADPRIHDPFLASYLDRSLDAPGMIRDGDVVVRAFAAVGWEWGGRLSSPDYQHFSVNGR